MKMRTTSTINNFIEQHRSGYEKSFLIFAFHWLKVNYYDVERFEDCLQRIERAYEVRQVQRRLKARLEDYDGTNKYEGRKQDGWFDRNIDKSIFRPLG